MTGPKATVILSFQTRTYGRGYSALPRDILFRGGYFLLLPGASLANIQRLNHDISRDLLQINRLPSTSLTLILTTLHDQTVAKVAARTFTQYTFYTYTLIAFQILFGPACLRARPRKFTRLKFNIYLLHSAGYWFGSAWPGFSWLVDLNSMAWRRIGAVEFYCQVMMMIFRKLRVQNMARSFPFGSGTKRGEDRNGGDGMVFIVDERQLDGKVLSDCLRFIAGIPH